jgi:hypothetical protein
VTSNLHRRDDAPAEESAAPRPDRQAGRGAYRPDESRRREQAREWLRTARGKEPEPKE